MPLIKHPVPLKTETETVDLKYPRREKRTIENETFEIVAPTSQRSKIMSSIKSRDSQIEKLVEKALINSGLNFTKPEYVLESIPGNPDFVIPRQKVAVFCDGNFWHGYKFDELKFASNSQFWLAKIQKNINRDNEVNKQLANQGWKVFRFWEHEIKENPALCIEKVSTHVKTMENREKLFQKKKFTFVDLYSGIGGFRAALEESGGKCLGFSEIDKGAISVYKKNYLHNNNEEVDLGSVTGISKLPFSADLIVGGVPCQSWSVAGKMRGFEDPRGQLWHDTIRIVDLNQPKAFIFENVKGLSDPRNKANLDLLINSFKGIGYNVSVKVLNSYDFGLPQNRERIFIVGFRNDIKLKEQFQFPKPINKNPLLKEFIEISNKSKISKKVFDPKDIFGEKIPFSRNKFQKLTELNDFFVLCDTRDGHTTIHSWDLIKTSKKEKAICLAILKNRRKSKYGPQDGNPIPFTELKKLIPTVNAEDVTKLVSKKILRKTNAGYEFVNSKNSAGINGIYRVYLPDSNVFSTLTATGTKDMISTIPISAKTASEYKEIFIKEVLRAKKYRPISSREAGKLQGFPEWFTIHENSKLAQKQFGNAVSVPVVFHLTESILKTGAL